MTNTNQRSFQSIAPGVELCVLRRHPDGGVTFLARMEKDARAPLHDHPGGEETYLLSGRLRIDRRTNAIKEEQGDVHLAPGDYLFAPPGETHGGYAEEDTLLLVVAPGGLNPITEAR